MDAILDKPTACAPAGAPDSAGPASDAGLMTIGEMCAAFGVTPRTLRFYESKELLAPRRIGPRRLYSRRDRARLKLTLRGKRFGFSLEQIRQLLDLYDRDDGEVTQLNRSWQTARDHLRDMEARRAELDSAIADLRAQILWAEERLRAMRPRPAE